MSNNTAIIILLVLIGVLVGGMKLYTDSNMQEMGLHQCINGWGTTCS